MFVNTSLHTPLNILPYNNNYTDKIHYIYTSEYPC